MAAEAIVGHYEPNNVIFSQGDDANALFIVKKGIVDVIKDGNFIASVPEGSFFGESALMEDSKAAKRSATISAKTEVVCLSLAREHLIKAFGQDVQAISLTNHARAALRKSAVLSKFTNTQNEIIMKNCQISSMESGETVFEKDTEYNSILLILEGTTIAEDDVIHLDIGRLTYSDGVYRIWHRGVT